MDDNKDLILKVKVDSYKDLQNYLKNELKISKEDIEAMLERLMERVIEKKLNNSTLMEQVAEKMIRRYLSKDNYDYDKVVNAAIEKCVGEFIVEKVRENLKALELLK